ncbi:helix-turn-helix domain-containing protein [Halomonas sp. ISL-60]|uniref:helix-turn-helix domain-containing protein n=1 Tax=Halomonas sp. ISL-56 TaxID=2819149 RepID=UPI001BE536DF|nr:helix-turn-helix domain-containing protein [Halomonas sp. ISL-60]MBT2800700.1 helix-turn-helix domain-containing protein [Halomonas sp. ISL-56]
MDDTNVGDITLLTVTETAKLLSVHRSTVYRLILEDSEFPAVYEFGFGKRFNKEDVLNYILSKRT